MKKWWKNFINSDASVTVFIILIFALTFAVVYFGMSSEMTTNENGEKVHYSRPIKDRAHGGVGFGFGYSPRTHRFGYGFGTGTINFH